VTWTVNYSNDIPGRARALGCSLRGEQLCQEAAALLGAFLWSPDEDMEMPKEEEPKAHSQPNKGLPSVQEQDEVRLRE